MGIPLDQFLSVCWVVPDTLFMVVCGIVLQLFYEGIHYLNSKREAEARGAMEQHQGEKWVAADTVHSWLTCAQLLWFRPTCN